MELLVFLLGGAFGISLSSLCLSVEAVKRQGLTEDTLLDIIHECACILFIIALYNVCMQLW